MSEGKGWVELRCWGEDGDPRGDLRGQEVQPRAAGGNDMKLGWVVWLGEMLALWGPCGGSLAPRDLPAPSTLLPQNL